MDERDDDVLPVADREAGARGVKDVDVRLRPEQLAEGVEEREDTGIGRRAAGALERGHAPASRQAGRWTGAVGRRQNAQSTSGRETAATAASSNARTANDFM